MLHCATAALGPPALAVPVRSSQPLPANVWGVRAAPDLLTFGFTARDLTNVIRSRQAGAVFKAKLWKRKVIANLQARNRETLRACLLVAGSSGAGHENWGWPRLECARGHAPQLRHAAVSVVV